MKDDSIDSILEWEWRDNDDLWGTMSCPANLFTALFQQTKSSNVIIIYGKIWKNKGYNNIMGD